MQELLDLARQVLLLLIVLGSLITWPLVGLFFLIQLATFLWLRPGPRRLALLVSDLPFDIAVSAILVPLVATTAGLSLGLGINLITSTGAGAGQGLMGFAFAVGAVVVVALGGIGLAAEIDRSQARHAKLYPFLLATRTLALRSASVSRPLRTELTRRLARSTEVGRRLERRAEALTLRAWWRKPSLTRAAARGAVLVNVVFTAVGLVPDASADSFGYGTRQVAISSSAVLLTAASVLLLWVNTRLTYRNAGRQLCVRTDAIRRRLERTPSAPEEPRMRPAVRTILYVEG